MEYPRCLYGGDHAGDRYAVRNDRDATIAGLCEEHRLNDWLGMPTPGFHLRTWRELAEREGTDDASQQGSPRMGGDRATPQNGEDTTTSDEDTGIYRGDEASRQKFGVDDSRTGAESALALRRGPNAVGDRGKDGPAHASRYDHNLTDRYSQGQLSPSQGPVGQENSPVRSAPEPGTVRVAGAPAEVDRPPFAWWQGAGELVLEGWQHILLREPFPPTLFERNFEGEWYLPWVFCWRRLLEVFHPAVPQMVPLTDPQIIGDAVCIHYVLLVNGQFAGEAWGEGQRKGGNRKMTYGNACESAKSEAIRRIGKTLGVNLELWEPETIRALERSRKRA